MLEKKMSISEKLFSLGFVYNSVGNIFDKRELNPSKIPEHTFFKNNIDNVEMYAPTPNSEGMWDHLIMSLDFQEVILEETISEQSILSL
jgi:hypothetical protein